MPGRWLRRKERIPVPDASISTKSTPLSAPKLLSDEPGAVAHSIYSNFEDARQPYISLTQLSLFRRAPASVPCTNTLGLIHEGVEFFDQRAIEARRSG